VFRVTPQGDETVLYSFAGGSSDGAGPESLIQGRDGNFYGTTSLGGISACARPEPVSQQGPSECGTVFEVTPDGEESVLYFFSGKADGGAPNASLVQASDGSLLGTCASGGIANQANGAAGGGVLFRILGTGFEEVVYAFDGSNGNGALPTSLMQAADGNFYVTTDLGDTANLGAIVRVTADGAEWVVYSFLGGMDGRFPSTPLIQGSDGSFYGVTGFGGLKDEGTFFRLRPSGQEAVLYQFGTDQAGGTGPLTIVADGNRAFLGVTAGGGSSACVDGCGTVYQVAPSGTESALYQFGKYVSGNLVSSDDAMAVVESAAGTVYGITADDGQFGGGTFFSLRPDGVLSTLHAFGSKGS